MKSTSFFYLMNLMFWLSIGFMAGYWTIYFVNLGFTYSQIGLILLMNPIATMLFEIPTGVIADVYGRKVSVFICYFLMALSFFGIILSGKNIALILSFEFLAGISFTFETGALEAWLIDSVKKPQRQKVLAKYGFFGSIGFIAGTFLGGVLVALGIKSLFFITSSLVFLLALYTLAFGKEDYFKKRNFNLNKDLSESFKVAGKGIKYTFKNPVIFVFTLAIAVSTFSNTISFHAYQPYVINVGLPIKFIDWALSIAGVTSLFLYGYFVKVINLLKGDRNTVIFFTFMMGLSILLIGTLNNLTLIFLGMIAYTGFGEFAGGGPAYSDLMHKNIPSKIRATVLSTKNLIAELFGMFGLLAFGFISDYIGLRQGIILAGILIVLDSFIYLRLKKS